jgi:predicted ATPase
MSRTLIRAQVRYFVTSPPSSSSLLTYKYPDAPDYRRIPRALSHAYFSPLDSATRAAIDAQFAALTEGTPIQEGKTIRLWGRNLTVPRSAGHVAQFSFAELCGRALGAADYLEITQRFRTLFVKDVPRMGLSEKDKVGGVRVSTSHLLMLSFA